MPPDSAAFPVGKPLPANPVMGGEVGTFSGMVGLGETWVLVGDPDGGLANLRSLVPDGHDHV